MSTEKTQYPLSMRLSFHARRAADGRIEIVCFSHQRDGGAYLARPVSVFTATSVEPAPIGCEHEPLLALDREEAEDLMRELAGIGVGLPPLRPDPQAHRDMQIDRKMGELLAMLISDHVSKRGDA